MGVEDFWNGQFLLSLYQVKLCEPLTRLEEHDAVQQRQLYSFYHTVKISDSRKVPMSWMATRRTIFSEIEPLE